MEKKLYDLTIDPELQKVAPPLTSYELDLLTADLIEHGCKFPIITWNGVIVDGHNRYKICRENNIPFSTEDIDFEDTMAAKLWIVKNQLGRRNLHEFQRARMVLPLEEEIKTLAEKRRREAISSNNKGRSTVTTLSPSRKTRDILAELAGVSEGTLSKVKIILENADEDLVKQLESGQIKIHTAYKQVIEDIKKPAQEPLTYSVPAEAALPTDPERDVLDTLGVTSNASIPLKKKDRNESKASTLHLEIPEENRHPVEPIPFDVRTPDGEVAYPFGQKPETVKPLDFEVVEAQFDDMFDYFMVNLHASLEWISPENATAENKATIDSMLHDLYNEASAEINNYFENMKGESV